ncbi:hypothetical protein BGC30_09480 [Novacetimonas hansenii]|nr:hypothetical protein BGC30_09480 [Novacetimonas hansenii]
MIIQAHRIMAPGRARRQYQPTTTIGGIDVADTQHIPSITMINRHTRIIIGYGHAVYLQIISTFLYFYEI